jgi:hypothetical protein
MRTLEGFMRVWEKDFPEEELSPQRKNRVWGRMNVRFFPAAFSQRVNNIT